MNKNAQGFSVIELLVVLIVLFCVVAYGVLALINARTKTGDLYEPIVKSVTYSALRRELYVTVDKPCGAVSRFLVPSSCERRWTIKNVAREEADAFSCSAGEKTSYDPLLEVITWTCNDNRFKR